MSIYFAYGIRHSRVAITPTIESMAEATYGAHDEEVEQVAYKPVDQLQG